MPFGFELIVIVVMLVLNAVFAAYEMALASISRSRISALVNEKRMGAEAAAYMKNRMEGSLAVVQLGVTFVGAIAAATGGAGVEQHFSPFLQDALRFPEAWAEVIALTFFIIPLGCLTIVFGELIPKVFAIQNKEWVCLWLSPFMKAFARLVDPVVQFFEKIVKVAISLWSKVIPNWKSEDQGLHELKAALSFARSSKLIGAHEEKIVLSATRLSTRPISTAMIPISDAAMVYIKNSLSDALIRAHLDMHSRFPVCEKENDPQTIAGYVNFKDIVIALKVNPANPSIEGIMRPIRSYDASVPTSRVLEDMIREKVHIALVRSKDRTVEGLVTLEDIMEELVGEIEDEFDRMPTHVHAYGTQWLVGGGVLLPAVSSQIGKNAPAFQTAVPTATLNDWCTEKLKRTPQGGDVIEENGVRVMIRKTRRRKVLEAVVSVS